VIESDDVLEFPVGFVHSEIPAGMYSTETDSMGTTLLLRKIPGFAAECRPIDHIRSESATITPSDVLDRSYFEMEKFHSGLEHAHKQIHYFLENRARYTRISLDYKLAVLLFGSSGTGKTRYIDNVSKWLIKHKNAIGIRITTLQELHDFLQFGLLKFRRTMSGRLKFFVFEELSDLINSDVDEPMVRRLLRNPLLREDVLFLMTSNSPEEIPSTILDTPGLIDCLVEIGCKDFKAGFIEAWYQHILGESFCEEWKTLPLYGASLSPAYLKELFMTMKIFDIGIEAAFEAIEKRRRVVGKWFADGA
jgi:hypothetical protein